ncbi:MAG: cysteine desulfurase / selenocysteine lyase [Candidatus Thermoplasmatota archaeon]|nr:cysteine desulfurase / selenocysteine lyase [Candidatus Thermoplasmatota archaeon]
MDVGRIRRDFPVLGKEIGGKPPIYFDNACQTLRPRQVIEAVSEYYESFPACAGRSVHKLATEVSLRCDDVRAKAASFFGAEDPSEMAFVKNTTEGLNTVIMGLPWKMGDEIVTTDYEHNSVHVPVLRARDTYSLKHRVVRSSEDLTFDLSAFEETMSKKVKLVAMCLTSNVTGCTLPAKEIVDIAHSYGAKVLLDAAQAAPSMKIDVSRLGVDFMAASAHKMLGPSGVGLFYALSGSVGDIPPIMCGGHGVVDTTYDSYNLLPPPERFETGLQNYSGIIGTGAALEYLSSVGLDAVRAHEVALNSRITRALRGVDGVSLIGPSDPNLRGGIFSFNVRGLSPHDVAMILDNSKNIMMRSGMHCCHPLFHALKLQGCARASAYLYNTPEEADVFSESVKGLAEGFRGR